MDYLSARTDDVLVEEMLAVEAWIFRNEGPDAMDKWRSQCVKGTPIAPEALHITGSAAVGFSLWKEKAGRRFKFASHPDGPSDIDIAVVDHDLFVSLWESCADHDRRHSLKIGPNQRETLRSGIYWGYVPSYWVPGGTEPALTVMAINNASRRSHVCRGHPSSIRVYRRREDLYEYQMSSLKKTRRFLTDTRK